LTDQFDTLENAKQEEKEKIEQKIRLISTQSGILSRFTGFVAVDKSVTHDPEDVAKSKTVYLKRESSGDYNECATSFSSNYSMVPLAMKMKKSSFNFMSGIKKPLFKKQSIKRSYPMLEMDMDGCSNTSSLEECTDLIVGLADLQSFDGSWVHSDKLNKFLINQGKLKVDAFKNLGSDQVVSSAAADINVQSTLLCLAALEINAPEKKIEWELFAQKAKDYLSKKQLNTEMLKKLIKHLIHAYFH
ncbi:Vacuolar protein sorting-associated protein 26A, partial [Cichlidogyrus casuarinus]